MPTALNEMLHGSTGGICTTSVAIGEQHARSSKVRPLTQRKCIGQMYIGAVGIGAVGIGQTKQA